LVGTDRADQNARLGVAINALIWNERRFDLIPDFFTEDVVADHSPRAVHRGWAQLEQAVERAHRTFEGFREDVHRVIADDDHVVLHFTISGRHVEAWGPIPATNRVVEYDEIVIMSVRAGKVCHQVGVADNLLALQQLGAVADPTGFTGSSPRVR
jgi:predicted ester cyclase